ncbi:MAG: malonyl-CoA decarboxylase [Gammaproteobacteria bacterium]|jgi:malonyl-CoA decarboxylase
MSNELYSDYETLSGARQTRIMSFFGQILKFPLRRKDITTAVKSLLRIKGEASAIKLAHRVLQLYAATDKEGKENFFRFLLTDLGPDETKLSAAIEAYREAPDANSYIALLQAVEPLRQDLIRTLNWAPSGTATLISMRADLLTMMRDNSELRVVDYDFQHLLTSWFNRGFLNLQRISWNTPAFILEKLIRYESVHEIRDWKDLQRRLADDRRCFAFFHPQLPDEPLIFVEVALTKGLVSNISDVLDDRHHGPDDDDPVVPDTAIFYSINNCQVGLRGISFGNFLIKQVADELADEISSLRHYATLSPIPGFSAWLETIRLARGADWLEPEDYDLLAKLQSPFWYQDEELANALKPLMMTSCARYLVDEKSGEEPLDPVARFHLSNGARIERINWLGDVSEQRLDQSYGMLVNYVYDRRSVVKNHESYVGNGRIATSSAINSIRK